jgi:hypothetical protein
VALPRLVSSGTATTFKPAALAAAYTSTYTNGHDWWAQWDEYCRRKGVDGTEYLSLVAGPGAQPYDPANGLKWPPLPTGTRVLLIPANSTASLRMCLFPRLEILEFVA